MPWYFRKLRLGLFITALATLSGCGGGGGSGVASTPVPQAPAAVAPPANPVNATLAAPLKTETFNNLSARATEIYTSSALLSADAGLQGTAATISFDAATQTYVFSMPAQSASGAATDRYSFPIVGVDPFIGAPCPANCGTPSGTLGRLTQVGGPAPGSTDLLTYKYVATAQWASSADIGSGRFAETSNWAVFGATTPAGGVPTTGSATYQIDVTGEVMIGPLVQSAGHSHSGGFYGTGTASFDFTGGKFTMQAPVNGHGFDVSDAQFTASGQIASASRAFTGTMSIADTTPLKGTVQGWFFGPAAQEIGGVFAGSAGNGHTVAGTVTGH